jgi:hypothetical protein
VEIFDEKFLEKWRFLAKMPWKSVKNPAILPWKNVDYSDFCCLHVVGSLV